jgi:hypothetical protein
MEIRKRVFTPLNPLLIKPIVYNQSRMVATIDQFRGAGDANPLPSLNKE